MKLTKAQAEHLWMAEVDTYTGDPSTRNASELALIAALRAGKKTMPPETYPALREFALDRDSPGRDPGEQRLGRNMLKKLDKLERKENPMPDPSMWDPDAVKSRIYSTETGRQLIQLTAERDGLDIKYQDDHLNAITDAITAILHAAAENHMDTDMILRVAAEHFIYEQGAHAED